MQSETVAWGLAVVLLGALLSWVFTLIRDRISNVEKKACAKPGEMHPAPGIPIQTFLTELRADRTAAHSDSEANRTEIKDGLRRVHERVDEVLKCFVRREECITARDSIEQRVATVEHRTDAHGRDIAALKAVGETEVPQ